jgi:hypothetical protein
MRNSEGLLSGRERGRMRAARENGFLNARCSGPRRLIEAFSLWCWLLKIPMVWEEGLSPRSRYGRLRLDLFTTSNSLTAAGQAEIQSLRPARASPHDACWDRVPLRELDGLAKRVYRAATRAGNFEPMRAKLVVDVRRERLFAVA